MLIFPNKYANPDLTVINVSSIMLKHLRKNRIVSYEKLYHLIKEKNLSPESLFRPSLSLLFLLGLIEYRIKIDSFWVLQGNMARFSPKVEHLATDIAHH